MKDKEIEVFDGRPGIQVRYHREPKIVKITAQDPGWKTPFQPMIIGDILTALYNLMHPDKNVKFEYYTNQATGEFGYRAIPK
jgi:1,4-dihydroxy-2-naphthoyl-CoA synthase